MTLATLSDKTQLLERSLQEYRTRPLRPYNAPGIGNVALITGSLGPGGAERQMVRSAIHLAEQEAGEINVIVKSHGPEKRSDFLLPLLKESKVIVTELQRAEVTPLHELSLPELLLPYAAALPSAVRYGLERLVNHFRTHKTDVAYIWQDGAVLLAALAALVAGVPRIVVSVRGFPPSIRRHLYREEYEVLYPQLAEIPGVQFVSNSRAAAAAYCDWLGLDNDRFSILYNGVAEVTREGGRTEEELWQEFSARTEGATETIGGVFRLHPDKRPHLALRFLKGYLERYPESRAILVGGGGLLEDSQLRAKELGVADRILFTGLSDRVGYWLDKMDAVSLFSQFEGLPNALLEAQSLGKPVLTTPAGGAAECFIPGETGYLFEDGKEPDLEKGIEPLHSLIARSREEPNLAEQARSHIQHHFSIPGMIERTRALLKGESP